MKSLLLITALLVWPLALAEVHSSEERLRSAKGPKSGIVGEVSIIVCPVINPGGCPPTPYQATISIFNERGKLVSEAISDESGSFIAYLKPGTYTLVPQNPEPPQ